MKTLAHIPKAPEYFFLLMKYLSYFMLFLGTLFLFSCNKESQQEAEIKDTTRTPVAIEKEKIRMVDKTKKVIIPKDNSVTIDSILLSYNSLSDSTFVELNKLDNTFAMDMKYATSDNFLGEQVYDCPKCLIRAVVAKSLLKANKEFHQLGLKIKFFDCYRPNSVQHKMWAIKPNTHYVANPTTGSIHNRGAAVDVTLIDSSTGTELDMGTSFDHFGIEAHHAYKNLPESVINNRAILKDIMERAGFKAQKSEWWHYSFIGSGQFPISNTPIICNVDSL